MSKSVFRISILVLLLLSLTFPLAISAKTSDDFSGRVIMEWSNKGEARNLSGPRDGYYWFHVSCQSPITLANAVNEYDSKLDAKQKFTLYGEVYEIQVDTGYNLKRYSFTVHMYLKTPEGTRIDLGLASSTIDHGDSWQKEIRKSDKTWSRAVLERDGEYTLKYKHPKDDDYLLFTYRYSIDIRAERRKDNNGVPIVGTEEAKADGYTDILVGRTKCLYGEKYEYGDRKVKAWVYDSNLDGNYDEDDLFSFEVWTADNKDVYSCEYSELGKLVDLQSSSLLNHLPLIRHLMSKPTYLFRLVKPVSEGEPHILEVKSYKS